MEPMAPVQREPWWTPFRRPSSWIAIFGFGILNAVVLSLGLPDVLSAVISAALLVASVSVVTRPKSFWMPLVGFLAFLSANLAVRVGGLSGFLTFEGALLVALVVALVLRRRKTPTPR